MDCTFQVPGTYDLVDDAATALVPSRLANHQRGIKQSNKTQL